MGLSLPGTMPIEDMQGGGVLAPKFSGSVQQPSLVEQALSSTTFPDLSVQTGTGTGTVLNPLATSGAGDYINQAIDSFTRQPTSTGGLGGLLGGLFSSDGIGNAISGISGIYGLEEQQKLARQLGPTVQAQAEQLAARAGEAAKFEPFTITSTPGLGGVQIGPGGVTLQPGQGAEALTSTALGGAQGILEGLLAPRADREAAILAQIEAARAPQRQREALAEEQRLLAQGRIGTQSAMFGGATPETLARMQAIEEQRSKDVLAAMNQAGTEQTQQEALLKSILGTAYTPQTQALGLLQAGTDPAKLVQSGQLASGEALKAAIPYVTQATIAGEETARDYTVPLLQAYTGLLSPTIQAAGQAVGAQDIATQIGSAVQGGVTDLYNRIFG